MRKEIKYIILGIVLVAIVVVIYFTYLAPATDPEVIIRKGLKAVKDRYGIQTAKVTEQIFRLETGNYKYGFTKTLAPGMHPATDKYPWGWGSALDLWDKQKKYSPTGVITMKEGGTGKDLPYLKFKGIGGFMTVGHIMSKRGNNAGRWYSSAPAAIESYNNKAAGIETPVVNSLS